MQKEKWDDRGRVRETEKQGVRGTIWRTRLRRAGEEAVWGCAAWILGQAPMLFGTYPLGLALLCGSAKHTVAVLVGLLLTSFSNMRTPIVYVCMYLAAALIRVLASIVLDTPEARFELPDALKKRLHDSACAADAARSIPNEEGEVDGARTETRLARLRRRLRRTPAEGSSLSLWEEVRDVFSESVCLRMSTAAIGALIVALYRVFDGGFRYYDLFAAVFSVVLTPVAVAVYSVALEGRISSPVLQRISEGALLFSLVFAARSVTLLGLPLSPILALFFSFYVCAVRGRVQGIVAGLLCGLAYVPIYAPACLLAALIYLLFHSMERENAAILLGCSAMVSWIVYVSGGQMLLTMVPVSLLAGFAFTLVCKLRVGEWNKEAPLAEAPMESRAAVWHTSGTATQMSDFAVFRRRFRLCPRCFTI